jgi:hypothetical protein
MRPLAPACLLAGIVTTSVGAWAGPNEPAPADADALFAEGRRLMKDRRFAEACPKLAESQKRDPAVGTLLNLALCYEKNGQVALAWSAYLAVARDAHGGADEDRRQIALAAADALKASIGRITVELAEPELDALVVTNDSVVLPRASWGAPVVVDPGEHVLTAAAEGRRKWSAKLAVLAGQSVTVTIPALERAASEAPPNPAATGAGAPPVASNESRRNLQRGTAIAVGAVGVASLGAGAVLAINGKVTYDKGACRPDGGCATSADVDERRSGIAQARLATVALGVGLVAAVGAVVTWYTTPPPTPATAVRHTLQPVASVGADGWTVSLTGAW